MEGNENVSEFEGPNLAPAPQTAKGNEGSTEAETNKRGRKPKRYQALVLIIFRFASSPPNIPFFA